MKVYCCFAVGGNGKQFLVFVLPVEAEPDEQIADFPVAKINDGRFEIERKVDPDACLGYLADFVEQLTAIQAEAGIVETMARLERSMNDLFQGRAR